MPLYIRHTANTKQVPLLYYSAGPSVGLMTGH